MLSPSPPAAVETMKRGWSCSLNLRTTSFRSPSFFEPWMVSTLSLPNNPARVLVSTSWVARYSVKMSTFMSGVFSTSFLSPRANPSSFESSPGNASRRARSSSTSLASPLIRLCFPFLRFAVAPPMAAAAFSSGTSSFPPSIALCVPRSTSTRRWSADLSASRDDEASFPKVAIKKPTADLSWLSSFPASL